MCIDNIHICGHVYSGNNMLCGWAVCCAHKRMNALISAFVVDVRRRFVELVKRQNAMNVPIDYCGVCIGNGESSFRLQFESLLLQFESLLFIHRLLCVSDLICGPILIEFKDVVWGLLNLELPKLHNSHGFHSPPIPNRHLHCSTTIRPPRTTAAALRSG